MIDPGPTASRGASFIADYIHWQNRVCAARRHAGHGILTVVTTNL
jgi:hypothetical protein